MLQLAHRDAREPGESQRGGEQPPSGTGKGGKHCGLVRGSFVRARQTASAFYIARHSSRRFVPANGPLAPLRASHGCQQARFSHNIDRFLSHLVTRSKPMAAPLQLYDNYTRSLRRFEPLVAGRAGFYACGPTVYDYQHIGNYRTFLFEDVLKRVLEWNGYTVRHVMNITDVGHLTSDADTGEDKMEKGARRTGKTAWEIARLYTEAFLADLELLNIENPTVLCRATDHIREQIEFIADIEKNGFAYSRRTACTSTRRSRRTMGTSHVSTSRARRPASAWTSATSVIRPTSRCGNSPRPARSGRWSGTAHGAAATRAGTSSARRWRRNIWATSSTSTAVARTTFRSTTRTKSPRPRRVWARGSPISGCTATFC